MSSPPLMAAFAGRRLARDSDSDETADETVDEDDDNDDVALEAEGWDLLADAPAGGSGDTGSEQSVLGYGAHSIVRLLPDRQRVVKSVGFADCSPQAAGELRRLVATETAILQQLHAHHPNMVKLHGVVEDATRVGIVMDRAPGKDLAQWVVAAGGPWAEDKTRMVVQQLVSVLQYIHAMGFVHGDIKLENVVWDDETATLKLVDFGCSRQVADTEQLKDGSGARKDLLGGVLKMVFSSWTDGSSNGGSSSSRSSSGKGSAALLPILQLNNDGSVTSKPPATASKPAPFLGSLFSSSSSSDKSGFVSISSSAIDLRAGGGHALFGSLFYAAPELLFPKRSNHAVLKYPFACDIWSFGVLIYALLTGQLPFGPKSRKLKGPDERHKLREEIWTAQVRFPDGCTLSEDVRQLISGMITRDSSARLTLDQVKEHPWLMLAYPTTAPDGAPVPFSQPHETSVSTDQMD